MKRVIIATYIAFISSSAWAQSPADFSAVDAKLQACLAKHGDTPGVDNCYGVAKAAADRRLNDVYAGLVNTFKHPGDPIEVRDYPEILKRLVASERAWIAFRDAECSY